jgi:hypothetical protein
MEMEFCKIIIYKNMCINVMDVITQYWMYFVG